MNVAVFADVSNLYHSIDRKFLGRKLDFCKLIERAGEFGTVVRAFAYGSQVAQEAETFIGLLRNFGWTPKFKQPRMSEVQGESKKVIRRAEWDVGIAMDAVRMSKKVQVAVLCSSDTDLIPLLDWLKDEGVICVVLACGVPRELRERADKCFEIDDLLFDKKETA